MPRVVANLKWNFATRSLVSDGPSQPNLRRQKFAPAWPTLRRCAGWTYRPPWRLARPQAAAAAFKPQASQPSICTY